jgi:sRNA-binding protein
MKRLSLKKPRPRVELTPTMRGATSRKLKPVPKPKPEPVPVRRSPEIFEKAKAWALTFPPFKSVVPLQLGIRQIMAEQRPEGVSHAGMKRFLWKWCNAEPYQQALAKGGARFALDGTEAGVVTEEQRERAKKRVKKMEVER